MEKILKSILALALCVTATACSGKGVQEDDIEKVTSLPVIYVTTINESPIDKLEKVLEGLREDVLNMENVKGDYKLLGINEFSSSSIKYLVCIECKANCQYQIKRDYFKLVKKSFDKNKIEIPYNKLDVNVRGKNE